MLQYYTPPIRVIDGLIIAAEATASDLEFIVCNKVTHIVNCASKHVPNHWESLGIKYLTYGWLECQHQFTMDMRQNYLFINQAIDAGESVLVHSVRGQTRAVYIICTYLMRKFHWCWIKCMQYLQNLKQDLELQQNLLTNLQQLEDRMKLRVELSSDWNKKSKVEELIRNTHLNSLKSQESTLRSKNSKHRSKMVSWAEQLITMQIPPYHEIVFSRPGVRKFSYPNSLKQVHQLSERKLPKSISLNKLVNMQFNKLITQMRPQTAPLQRHRVVRKN